MTHEPDSTADVSPELSRRRVLVGGATAVVCVAGVSGTASAQGTTSGVIPTPERWPDANLAGFEIRYGHSEETGGNTADRSGSEETAAADGGGTETEGTDAAAETGENGTETGDGMSNGGETDSGETDSGETDDGEATDAEASADDPPACDFTDWPPDEVESHDVRLVNRKAEEDDPDAETPEEDTTLYVSADVDVQSNAPYLINTFERCDTDFVGLELESVSGDAVEQEDDPAQVEDDQNESGGTGNGDTPAQGPGFGVLGALAAAVGLGHLLARRRSG